MKVHVLKVRGHENIDEMNEGVEAGHTIDEWQMPKDSELGDLVVWYSGRPHQNYVAWGWVAGETHGGFHDNPSWYMGRVAGMRAMKPVSRQDVAAACGLNEHGVPQIAETLDSEIVPQFLRALNFPSRFVTARELISAEVAVVLASVAERIST